MDSINQAILQDEIRQAINALFKSGQVGRTEPGKVLLSETRTTSQEFPLPVVVPFVDGRTYTIIWDSIVYERTAYTLENEPGSVIVGDYATGTGTDPFILIYDGELTVCLAPTKGNTVSILSPATIHPIDPKFIPGAVLPVVDLTGCSVGEEITDEAINATLTKHAATRLPIIGITKTNAEGEVSEVYACAGSGIAFVGSVTSFQIASPTVTGKNGWVLDDAT